MPASVERFVQPVPRARTQVLLVHPDDDSRDMYAEFLRLHEIDLVCSADMAEALALAARADVVVTELRLNAADGCEFIRRLRIDRRTRSKPVIVVTSSAWQTERVRAETAGCDLFLIKPCLPDVLLHHVR